MSATADEPSEHAEPRRVGFDWGWADGWSGLDAFPNVQLEYREGYEAGYALGVQEADELRGKGYCPNCGSAHRHGECSLSVVPRDPWWVRLLTRVWPR